MTFFGIIPIIFILGLGSWSDQSFQTIPADELAAPSRTSPSPPILLAPSDDATAVPINTTLTWHSSAGALTYHLQLSKDSTFATTVIDSPALTDTSLRVTALEHKTIYYWRVNATGAEGTSPFSATYSFRSHVVPGDFSGWGEIQSVFAYFILRHVTNISVLTGDDLETAEVSGDGTVSAYDAALVLQVANGLIGRFPVDE